MATQPPKAVNLSAIKARQQISWTMGDITIIVRPLVGVAENLCEAVQLLPGQKVLDIATCTGNVALGAARRYCEVTAIDYAASLLEKARERAAVEMLSIDFLEADAENLPFSDGSFDVVLSTFGVMFAPDQEKAASELLRVCRSGGKIGLSNWTPGGFFGQIGRVMQAYAPAPPGLKPPGLWGDETYLRELLGDEVVSFQATKHYFYHCYRSLQHAVEVTCNDLGPTVAALQSLESDTREHVVADVRAAFAQANQATDGTVVVPAEYLEVVAVRR